MNQDKLEKFSNWYTKIFTAAIVLAILAAFIYKCAPDWFKYEVGKREYFIDYYDKNHKKQ